ncbi:MAG: FHA domain-containing protein [Planctomycetia bacterium]|nr:FHA domain-containing protein [Planctomycetia bacterium]
MLIRDPLGGESATRLVAGQRLTLGRAPTNHVVIPDERASRLHAEIIPSPAGWTIRDLASRNGTLVGDALLDAERPLAPGDVFSIGRMEITFCHGDPPEALGGTAEQAGTSPAAGSADVEKWQASITHRRAHSRLLDDIGETCEIVPRVGRAAAELCRLAFALGKAADARAIAGLALESALQGVEAAGGVVFLPAGVAAGQPASASAGLEPFATVPDGWPGAASAVLEGAIAAVMRTNEALLAGAPLPGGAATMSAPIRAGGRAVGAMHVEMPSDGRKAGPDDLEFVMAVCDALGVAVENLSAREILSSRLASTADENERLKRRLGEESRMVGASPVLEAIKGQIARVAGTKATILIRGESGAGKELVARAIHDASDRRNGPFVCMNCAALSETLLESELFGHEKGAFTGATERKAGKFETAHKGTLMLDEIGEMSPAIQAKFLRVLEGHPFERVGGSNRVQVDVRVVAATNRDLEQAVAAGEFRRDLYFRLKVVEIIVPPLRKRPEDIEPLARHYLRRFAAEAGRRVHEFTPAAIHALQAYHWPGNIRELRNVVERAVVLSADDAIDAHELALSQLSSAGETGRKSVERPAPFVPLTLDELEQRHVQATLAAVGGNKTKAATMLGIERSTLDRKLARWAKG